MQNLPSYSRDFLNKRHRLSHQQIDDLLNENLSKDHLTEKYSQLFQVNEFLNLTDQFREANISFIPLKGPLLSYKLHLDPSYRYSNDLDFLVPLKEINNAISVLEEKGYTSEYFSWTTSLRKQRILTRFTNQILFVHPEKKIYVEIHWRLFAFGIMNSKVLKDLLKSNTNEIVFKERSFQTFNYEMELLYLIIHGGLHAWFRLKWLVDIKDYMEKIPIDPEEFSRLVEKLNALRMVSLCNAMLTNYFPDTPLIHCKLESSTKKRLNFVNIQIRDKIFYEKPFSERVKTYWYTMNCFPGFKYKSSVIGVIFYSKYLSLFKFHRTS